VPDNSLDLIVSDPAVLHGTDRFVGTRIPVTVVLDCVDAGVSDEEIHREYPTLPAGSIPAALAYGARSRS
jgi:uncharacterized protein (DUF433 family)